MNARDEQFLNLKRFPARLRAEEAGLLLGFSAHEIPILTAHGLLKPLGRPLVTGVKYFSFTALEELRNDEKWLAKASDCIVQYWQRVNQNRRIPRRAENPGAARSRNNFRRQSPLSDLRSSRQTETAME